MLIYMIEVLIVPGLQSSARKAADLLVGSRYDIVFLNFPRNIQSLIWSYAFRLTKPWKFPQNYWD